MSSNSVDRYAVVGNPIGHSKSPAIHSAFAEQTEQIMTYEPICAESFASVAKEFFSTGGLGMNVTVPFKLDALSFADELNPRAARAGASNTLIRKADGRIYADNTDGVGMVRDIQTNLGWPLKDKNVLLLGAGGAVRGVLEPLLSAQPASLHIANRTVSKAQALADEFADIGSITVSSFEDVSEQAYDLIINGSAASLLGDNLPLADSIARNACCYDMMYGAVPTVFMTWAEENGATATADGLGMLLEQAAESFYLWRGVRPQTRQLMEKMRQQLQKG